MKVIEHLTAAQDLLISFEILPPLKGNNIQSVNDILEKLMEFNPPFINVTYHRPEYTYKQREGGLYEKVDVRKRPGTVGICAAIMYKFGVDAVPHLVCGGFSKRETEDALVDLNYLGIHNVLLLRGDPVKNEKNFVPETKGNRNALELVEQTVSLNQGTYLDEDLVNPQRTDFCIGVAGYPEKHFEAPNFAADLRYLKRKVDAGADYIVTQMFFDNAKYFTFVDRCREIGIHVPIIPGIKPLTTRRQIDNLPGIFHVELPEELITLVEACKNKEDVQQVGIEWAIEQSRELKAKGVPCIHFYTMSEVKAVQAIMRAL